MMHVSIGFNMFFYILCTMLFLSAFTSETLAEEGCADAHEFEDKDLYIVRAVARYLSAKVTAEDAVSAVANPLSPQNSVYVNHGNVLPFGYTSSSVARGIHTIAMSSR
ncbi:hypothetical protein GCK32_001032 [Trichostrongylus colubriformis]|uniref:Uncharacterized protein n=1 Tax=Trichostrongylus colubriformis TaxID=6319 RepID=A0AAN8F5G0_TRICO